MTRIFAIVPTLSALALTPAVASGASAAGSIGAQPSSSKARGGSRNTNSHGLSNGGWCDMD